jgi:hypothetical protein
MTTSVLNGTLSKTKKSKPRENVLSNVGRLIVNDVKISCLSLSPPTAGMECFLYKGVLSSKEPTRVKYLTHTESLILRPVHREPRSTFLDCTVLQRLWWTLASVSVRTVCGIFPEVHHCHKAKEKWA